MFLKPEELTRLVPGAEDGNSLKLEISTVLFASNVFQALDLPSASYSAAP